MIDKKKAWQVFCAAAAVALISPSAAAFDYELYGSLRIAAEAVSPDDETTLESYSGLRDAYSRIGLKVSHELSTDATAYAQLELPVDSRNIEIQDPWDQDQDLRIGKVGIRGRLGDLAVGQMWMPYYNAIAYPVDMFSSYYSGFATFTTFRKGNTLAYYTPKFGGFSAAASYSYEKGAFESNGDQDDRWQATVSYDFDGVILAGGLDRLGGTNDLQIWGASLTWPVSEALNVGAKYERHDSDIKRGYGADGDVAMNLYAGYTMGRNTVKAMIANVDNYGEQIIHLGLDHQYNDDLKFFVEYYSEEKTAAITTKGGGAEETCWACDGGYVVTAGLRYDFGTK